MNACFSRESATRQASARTWAGSTADPAPQGSGHAASVSDREFP